MDTTTALIGAGVCAALGGYHHVVYPAAMAVLGRHAPAVPETPRHLPSIDVLMPAFNEARFVGAKIDALAMQDYPLDRVRVLIGCDGCTDDTARMAKRAATRHPELNVQVYEFSKNLGKTAVINRLIPDCDAELIVFSDVSALPAPNAFLKTAAHFVDLKMGAVGGGYALPGGAAPGERLYWHYQAAVKRGESRLAGLIGAHGAFYAVRRSALQPLPEDTINDDFIIPMCIAAAGWKTRYDPSIQVQEIETVCPDAESCRRRRIGAGNLQQIQRLTWPALASGHLGLILALASGKALRVAMGPLFLAGLACLGVAALNSIPALALLMVVMAASLKGPGRYAAHGHIQSMIGAMRYLRGGYRRWHRVTPHSV